jgi:signal transduction histidine kinase
MWDRRALVFRVAIGIVATVLAVALAVGWQILVVSDLGSAARGFTPTSLWFLVLGSVFFALVIVALVLLCAWLFREMRRNQRQQAFLDAVTHEMKTPLASLRLYVETLRRRDPDAERREHFLSSMEEDLERLDRTVEHVLAAARADSNTRPQEGQVDLRRLLADCIAEIRESHQLDPAAIRLESDRSVRVRGDEAELALVFRNLLENAVKYSDPPVDVRVAVTDEGDRRVRVQIADQGIGIPPGELRKIFRRFYRAGRDVQRTASGLGLGLFIVRDLLRRHGGRVEAKSEGAGRGSRFVVTLRAVSP